MAAISSSGKEVIKLQHQSEWISKMVVHGHEKTNFALQQLFWLRLIFDLFSDLMDQKMAGAKKVVKTKNQFFHIFQLRKGIFEFPSHRCCIFRIFFPELLMAATIPGVEIFN